MSTTVMELKREKFFPHLFASELLSVRRMTGTSFRFVGFLWRNIGAGAPQERTTWSQRQWQNHLVNPHHEFYAVYCDGEPAGCFEIKRATRLMQDRGGTVHVEAFGLLPEFIGEGLGPALLTRVVEKAFATGASRIVISSSTMDSVTLQRLFRSQGFTVLSAEP